MTYLTDTRSLTRSPRLRRLGLFGYLALYRQRKALAALDDRALKDIGLTREEAMTEARRPVWAAPHHWFSPLR